jgi:hypothetical protein
MHRLIDDSNSTKLCTVHERKKNQEFLSDIVVQTVKSPDEIMVWGGVSVSKTGRL